MKLNSSTIIKTIAFGALFILGSQMTASAQQVGGTPTAERFGDRVYEKNGLITIKADIIENQRLMQAGRSKELRGNNVTEIGHLYWGAPRSAKELEKYRVIATKLKTTPEDLFLRFTARANTYFLTFNNFLLANVIASNLEATHPDITADILLSGLRHRKSFTRTMRNFGLSLEEAKAIEKAAQLEIKESLR
jgi:hypothetical protein